MEKLFHIKSQAKGFYMIRYHKVINVQPDCWHKVVWAFHVTHEGSQRLSSVSLSDYVAGLLLESMSVSSKPMTTLSINIKLKNSVTREWYGLRGLIEDISYYLCASIAFVKKTLSIIIHSLWNCYND